MIVKMRFLNISGPRDDIDRVCEKYLSKYEMQIENAVAGKKGILRKIQRAFFKRCGNQDGSHEHSMGVPCEAVLSYASGRNLCTDASISFSFKYGRI